METSENKLTGFDVQERFIRQTVPGGHHLARAATAVQLRVRVESLPVAPEIRQRLAVLAGRRLTNQGVLIVESRAHRSQQHNRAAARERLIALIERASAPPAARRATRPDRASRAGRLADKKRQGAKKASRHGSARRDE